MSSHADDEKQWVKTQTRTFTRWLNMNLSKKGYAVIEEGKLAESFSTGLKLLEVINCLYGLEIPKHNPAAKATTRPVIADNVNIALNFTKEAGVPLHYIQVAQILDKDSKMIMGLIWSIILHYAISGISVEDATAKEGLLRWIQRRVHGFDHIPEGHPVNFGSSFRNGMVFCALIASYRPDLIAYSTLSPENAQSNLELAFTVAERDLGITRLLEPEDLLVERPDEKSVMAYAALFFNVLAPLQLKENAARRLARLLAFNRRIDGLSTDYERRARALIAFANAQSAHFSAPAFGETFADAQAAFAAYRSFVTVDKPAQAGEKIDTEAVFAELQTELSVNNRAAYVPPADASPEAVEAAFDALAHAERTYAAACRDNRFRFISKIESSVPQEKLDEINASFRAFDKNSNNSLDAVEFKAALTSLSVPFKNDEAFNKIFKEVSEGAATINFDQFLKFNMALVDDKDTPEQITKSFELMADGADTVTAQQLSVPPLSADDVEYLKSKMPASENGALDYKQYVSGQFKQ